MASGTRPSLPSEASEYLIHHRRSHRVAPQNDDPFYSKVNGKWVWCSGIRCSYHRPQQHKNRCLLQHWDDLCTGDELTRDQTLQKWDIIFQVEVDTLAGWVLSLRGRHWEAGVASPVVTASDLLGKPVIHFLETLGLWFGGPHSQRERLLQGERSWNFSLQPCPKDQQARIKDTILAEVISTPDHQEDVRLLSHRGMQVMHLDAPRCLVFKTPWQVDECSSQGLRSSGD